MNTTATSQIVPVCAIEAYDVVVCGGGTAGFCAAIASARTGARTAVIERFGMFGGTMTVGGVSAPALFHAHGKQIIAGIGWELMLTLAKNGHAQLPPAPYNLRHPQNGVELNAFQAAVEIDRMMQEAGVHIYFHQQIAHVCAQDGHVYAVLIATIKGLKRIEGKVFIDCTGDGSVSVMAGAEWEKAEELQPGSLNSIITNCYPAERDKAAIHADLLDQIAQGEMDEHDIWGLNTDWLHGRGRGRQNSIQDCYVINPGNNLNHVYPIDGSDNESRTKGELEGRRSIARCIKWMNQAIPGFEKAYISSCSPVVSIRESLRIVGRSYITGENYLKGVCPPDTICYSFYPIDVHTGVEKRPLNLEHHEPGLVPGIPFGALIARGFDNLMMAGRIASGDRLAQSAFRVQASCMAMGEAAGTGAALACLSHTTVDQLDVDMLRQRLYENGVILPGFPNDPFLT